MERGQRVTTPLVELLRNKMDGAADRLSRRKKLTERFKLKGISCCGASSFGLMMGIVSVSDGEDGDEDEGPHEPENVSSEDLAQPPSPNGSTAVPVASGMNLAAALMAERAFRAASPGRPNDSEVNGEASNESPFRVSLMKLLNETDGNDCEIHKVGKGSDDSMCCVCMVRKKDAAFIPCGHTFCRGCSRDLWFNRGFCPLCNRSIIEILDIF